MVSAVGGSSGFSLASLQQTQRPSPQERFASADADSSSGLSVEEYANFAPDFVEDIESSFTQIDSDGDGSLTEAELQSFAESEGLQGGPPPGGGPPPPPSGGGSSEETTASLIDELLEEYSIEEQSTITSFFTSLLSAQEESQAA